MDPLDDVLPEYDVRERHEQGVGLPPAAALARLLALPAAPDPVVRGLFALRGVRARDMTLVTFARRRIGFKEVSRTPHALVLRRDGRVALAIAFWSVADGESSSLLCTETRVAAADSRSRLAFRCYWLVVRPFSGLIRRRWLRAATRT